MFSIGEDRYGYVNLFLGYSENYNKPSVKIEINVGARGSKDILTYYSSEFTVDSTYEDLRRIMRIGEDVEMYFLDIGSERSGNIINATSYIHGSDTIDSLLKTVLRQEGHIK